MTTTFCVPVDGEPELELWAFETNPCSLSFSEDRAWLWCWPDRVDPRSESIPGIEVGLTRVRFVKHRIVIPRESWDRYLDEGIERVERHAREMRENWNPEWGEL